MSTEPAPHEPLPAAGPEPEVPSGFEPDAPFGAEARRRPRWAPWTSVVALVAGLAAALVGALVVGLVAVPFGADFANQPPPVTIAATVVQDLCLIGAALAFARMYGRLR